VAWSYLSHLECPRCGETFDPDQPHHLCGCGSPLLARYDLGGAAEALSPDALVDRPPTLWRYHELLPVRAEAHVVTMGEGLTPILPLAETSRRLGTEVLLKDEGLLPGGTFKARGAAVGVSRALELGVRTLAMPTNGNAGGAWALYGARAGLQSVIVMPHDAPPITRRECAAAGAHLYLIPGLINDAGRMVAAAVERYGWYDASTLKEPYRIEGKKTMGYEIAEQGGWRLPDVIIYPTGGGVGLIGMYKAFLELQALGWITGPLPRFVAVQAEGCAPIVRAFEAGAKESVPWPEARTVAFGINVPKALGDFLVLEALAATGGTAVAVSDEAILAARRRLARDEGLFVCPEGAATLAAAEHLRATGWIASGDRVLLLNTGTGLKYPETVEDTAEPVPLNAVLPDVAGSRA
jgi:threonine synthase